MNKMIWAGAAVLMILLVGLGLILPQLISTDVLPAWSIAVLTVALFALVVYAVSYLVRL